MTSPAEIAELVKALQEARYGSTTDELYALVDRAAAALEEVGRERDDGKAVKLWALLDDIDTLDDICKGNDAAFRTCCYKIQRKRFDIMSGEEYDAAISAEGK